MHFADDKVFFPRELTGIENFKVIADWIIQHWAPRTVLVAGGGARLLGDELRARGAPAVWNDTKPGDTGSTPTSLSEPGISIDPLACRSDLAVWIQAVESLSFDEESFAVANLCSAAQRILFVQLSENFAAADVDAVRSPLDWIRLFAQSGFSPVVDVDTSLLPPWTMIFERRDDPPSEQLISTHALLIDARIDLWRSNNAQLGKIADLGAKLKKQHDQLVRLEKLFVDKETELSDTHKAIDSIAYRDVILNKKRRVRSIKTLFSRLERRIAYIRHSIFFDPEWYAGRYGDVPAHADVAKHYLLHGSKLGRDPGPGFSSSGYLKLNVDVPATGYDPLVHFERYGKYEGRAIRIAGESTTPMVFRRLRSAGPTEEPLKPGNSWNYEEWISKFDRLTYQDRKEIKAHIATLAYLPLISVVMPVYDPPAGIFRQAIQSVLDQLYENLELCIADDNSRSPHVIEIIKEYADRDSRVKWLKRSENGHISAATNSALTLATGEFVALMDHDDILPDHALYEVAAELNNHPDADLLYSDEDHIDENGRRYDPHFKTDWNPELFLAQNMFSHLGVYRRSLIEKIGGLRAGFEGSQDYDLALRASRETTFSRIRHIPSILYHWRGTAAGDSFSQQQLARCVDAARRAKSEHLQILGENAVVEPHPRIPQHDRIRRPVPDPAPLVTLIVPTRNRADLLGPCLEGLLRQTNYDNFEVLIVDHESDEPETKLLLQEASRDDRVRIMPYKGEFNYSDMNNKAVALARGSIIGLINNDTEVIDPDWLREMVALAARPEYGAVGAKLLYPDRRVQHAGVVLGVGGVASHFSWRAPAVEQGYFGRLEFVSNVSAVTAACLVVRKALFEEAGGLNAVDLPVAYNDVDLCLKIAARGYLNVWTPFALLYHHESPSRGIDHLTPEKAARAQREADYMRDSWGEALTRDPFYNVNFSLESPDFDLASPPRRKKPWKN